MNRTIQSMLGDFNLSGETNNPQVTIQDQRPNTPADQRWVLEVTDDGFFRIKNDDIDQYLTLNLRNSNGRDLQLMAAAHPDDEDFQLWYLADHDRGSFSIRSKVDYGTSSNKVVDVRGGQASNAHDVIGYGPYHGNTNQRWSFGDIV